MKVDVYSPSPVLVGHDTHISLVLNMFSSTDAKSWPLSLIDVMKRVKKLGKHGDL